MELIFNKSLIKPLRKKLRNNETKAEFILWLKLKGRQVNGYKFRRQYSVNNYIIYFYCSELRLAIEVDGESHLGEIAEKKDQFRQKQIEKYRIKFLRFKNPEIYYNLSGVMETILRECKFDPPRATFLEKKTVAWCVMI